MRKTILMMLLAVVSINAMAEWEKIGVNSEGSIVYADAATIRKKNNKVKIWTLADFITPEADHGTGSKSMKLLHEYDCKEDQSRILYFTSTSGNMGTGGVVELDRNPSKWSPVEPNTIDATSLRFACKKR